MPALDKSVENEAKHAVYLQRYAGGLSKEMEPFLVKLKKAINAEIAQIDTTITRSRKFSRILKRIEKIQRDIYGEYSTELLEQLELFNEHEVGFEIDSLNSVVLSGSVELSAPATSLVWAAATTEPLIFPDSDGNTLLKPFTRDWSEKHIKRVSNAITNGVIYGDTTNQIAQRITGKGKLIDKKVRAEMRTIVRTSINHINTVARHQVLEDNSDIVTGYEWVSVLDGRTSSLCRPLDGQVFYNRDKGYKPRPPRHPGCRSTTAPVLDKRYQLDDSSVKRASSGSSGGKQVRASESYYTWLKKQSASFQNETIGTTRAALLRSGKITTEEFRNLTTDQKFRPLTIEQMRKKDPQLFTDVGI